MSDDARPARASRTRRPEYALWRQMLQKCHNPRSAAYPRFGGRGVTVCPRWRGPDGFDHFLADLGPRPFPGAGLRLIDPGGDFGPGNAEWADTRAARTLTHAGRTQSVAAWARKLGVSASTLRARLRDGWTGAATLTRPVEQKWPWYRSYASPQAAAGPGLDPPAGEAVAHPGGNGALLE